jgi:hypothetical protein
MSVNIGGVVGRPEEGEKLFKAKCTQCHTVAKVDLVCMHPDSIFSASSWMNRNMFLLITGICFVVIAPTCVRCLVDHAFD